MGNGFSWEKDMLPKIKDVVYRTFKGCQDSQTSDHKNRFEIYGLDLVLDEEPKNIFTLKLYVYGFICK